MNRSEPNRARDRELGMSRAITRRDFLNGIAVGAGSTLAGAWLPGLTLAADASPFAQDAAGIQSSRSYWDARQSSGIV